MRGRVTLLLVVGWLLSTGSQDGSYTLYGSKTVPTRSLPVIGGIARGAFDRSMSTGSEPVSILVDAVFASSACLADSCPMGSCPDHQTTPVCHHAESYATPPGPACDGWYYTICMRDGCRYNRFDCCGLCPDHLGVCWEPPAVQCPESASC